MMYLKIYIIKIPSVHYHEQARGELSMKAACTLPGKSLSCLKSSDGQSQTHLLVEQIALDLQ